MKHQDKKYEQQSKQPSRGERPAANVKFWVPLVSLAVVTAPDRFLLRWATHTSEGRLVQVLSKLDLSRVRIRLENIGKNATKSVSFEPSNASVRIDESYLSPTMSCLEDIDSNYPLTPGDSNLKDSWNIYGYDESTQNFKSLEGELLFCSSSVVKVEERYTFNLTVVPYFLTSMRKFENYRHDEGIRFAENPAEERNIILTKIKTESIIESMEPNSIVLIDGPLVGGNASTYIVAMDEKLREKDCIPLYFVKNSDSRLVIGNSPELSSEFNSDFHWATYRLKDGDRSPFFKYVDRYKRTNSKIFTYMKALPGFPERVEMHSSTYEKYHSLLPSLMNLIAYFYIVQGDYSNPQVRPIAVAERYAREGLRILNIPTLLGRMGFHPTVNQIRFG